MRPDARHDGELISESLATPESFTAVFERHFDAVHRYLSRRLGRPTADDLASTVFLRAFESRASFDCGRADARPWLYGIATNLGRHHARTEARRWRAYARSASSGEGNADDVDSRIVAESHGPALARALSTISRKDRDALLLYAWAALSYEDVALATGVPVGTVRSRIHRARRRLRAELPATVVALDDPTPVPEG
jgi:RNA polymerase sigma-70 factor (ECF subfamily)